jgi:hypothetical protein
VRRLTFSADGVKRQRFGVEVELDGLRVQAASEIVREYLGGEYDHLGREWKIADEPSVPRGFELITPPIYYADLPMLQEIFRILRQAGAHRAPVAGIHVHVGAEDLSLAQIRSLVNLYVTFGQLFPRLMNVNPARRLHYSQSIRPFAEEVNRLNPQTIDDIKSIWYEVSDAANEEITKYNTSRFTELNLNSYFYRGTLEFRTFNSTNHAGKLRAYVVLVLGLMRFAKSCSGTYPLGDIEVSSEAEAFAASEHLFTLLWLNGSEYRIMREHLMENISSYYSRLHNSNRREVIFESMGMTFDGSSCAEVLDEMMDNRYFDSPSVQHLLNHFRKRKPMAQKSPLLRLISARKAYEEYACALMRVLVSEGLGHLEIS